MEGNARDLIVQEEDIENIADTMVRLPGEGPLKTGRWFDLAIKLGTERAQAEELKDDLANKRVLLPDVLKHILTEWKLRNPYGVRLGYLIDVFNELRLQKLATKIEKFYQFKIDSKILVKPCSRDAKFQTQEPDESELNKRSAEHTIVEPGNERNKNKIMNGSSNTMQCDARNLILQDKDIEIISTTMVRLRGGGTLEKGRWLDLVIKLGTDRRKAEALREDLGNKFIAFPDFLKHILIIWKSENPNEATVGHLIDVLNELKLNELATKLEKHYMFKIQNNSSVNPGSEESNLKTKMVNLFNAIKQRFLIYTLVGFTILIILLHGSFLLNHNISTNYYNYHKNYEPPIPMSVQTYADYENVMHKVPFGSKIELSIYLQNSQDWPYNAELGNAHLVTILKLEGELDITTIMTILKGMVNVETLHITNTSQLFCHHEGTRSPRQIVKLELSHIKELILEDVGECPYFFRRLSKGVTMRNLRTLRIKSGVIDNNNIMYIRRLLQNADETLISIEFPNTLMLANIFDQKLGVLPSTTSLVIDFLDSSGADLLNINENICDMLPKITEILSYSGYLPWSHFINLSDCKKLNSVTLGVSMPENVSTVDLRELRVRFPTLVKAQLSFYFANISNGCSVLGMQEIEESFERLTFNDNCPKVDSDETS